MAEKALLVVGALAALYALYPTEVERFIDYPLTTQPDPADNPIIHPANNRLGYLRSMGAHGVGGPGFAGMGMIERPQLVAKQSPRFLASGLPLTTRMSAEGMDPSLMALMPDNGRQIGGQVQDVDGYHCVCAGPDIEAPATRAAQAQAQRESFQEDLDGAATNVETNMPSLAGAALDPSTGLPALAGSDITPPRNIVSSTRSRTRHLADPIRGDIYICPKKHGMFDVAARPQHDLHTGAIGMLSGATAQTKHMAASLARHTNGEMMYVGGLNSAHIVQNMGSKGDALFAHAQDHVGAVDSSPFPGSGM